MTSLVSPDVMQSFTIRDRSGRVRLRGTAEDPMYWFGHFVENLGGSRADALVQNDEVGGKVWLHSRLGLRLQVAE